MSLNSIGTVFPKAFHQHSDAVPSRETDHAGREQFDSKPTTYEEAGGSHLASQVLWVWSSTCCPLQFTGRTTGRAIRVTLAKSCTPSVCILQPITRVRTGTRRAMSDERRAALARSRRYHNPVFRSKVAVACQPAWRFILHGPGADTSHTGDASSFRRMCKMRADSLPQVC